MAAHNVFTGDHMTEAQVVDMVQCAAEAIHAVMEIPSHAADPRLEEAMRRALVALSLLGAQALRTRKEHR